jgi:hypothetical protein
MASGPLRANQLTLTDITGLTENTESGRAVALDTGDLRRKFNFGDRISELGVKQDPFFRMLSLYSKKPTDDPEFKYVEKRSSFQKRYSYVVAQGATEGALAADEDLGALAVDATLWIKVKTDYKSSGLIGSKFGQSGNAVDIGDAGTQPTFYIPGSLIKINTNDDVTSWDVKSYVIGRIQTVTASTSESVNLKLIITRTYSGSNSILCSFTAASTPISEVYDKYIAVGTEPLEAARSYIVGNAHGRGTSYPTTWLDQPFSTDYGYTQIFKTSLIMDNTMRATMLKYEGNEFSRSWREKLIEHKWDIETDLLFGTLHKDTDNFYYTQGIVDYALGFGNVFTLDISSKTHDEFLEDCSQFYDPRFNNEETTLNMVSTNVWNWMHKLGGYYANNVGIDGQFRSDLTVIASGNFRGLTMSKVQLSTGPVLNVVRNVHLDGSPVKMIGVNMRNVKYRPLVGNGINRDTSVYIGVESLERGGVDARVDLILTEAGLEPSGTEQVAVWK